MLARLQRVYRFLKRSGLISIALMAVLVFSFRSAIADWHDVPSESMLPTLEVGDRIVVNKLAYHARVPFTKITLSERGTPKRGEVITLSSPANGQRLVKRVCAVGGDVVEMRDGRLIVDGRELVYEQLGDGLYLEHLGDIRHVVRFERSSPRFRDFGPVTVPDGQILVMGDNRDNSADSRVFGFAPVHDVEGRVHTVAFSLNHDRYYLPKSNRWFHSVN